MKDETDEIRAMGAKYCLVFSQGAPKAQGGDVMALVVDGESCELDSIQCKHCQVMPSNITSWWSPLGIESSGGNANFAPKTGKAGYSFTGLDQFRILLQERIGMPVKFGARILAASCSAPPQAVFPVPHDGTKNCAKVRFREMFEPTISTFAPRERFSSGDDAGD